MDDATSAVTSCPELDELAAARPTPRVRAHVETCAACRLVVELIDERSCAAAARSRPPAPASAAEAADCARCEPLLAARDDGDELPPELAAWLAAHLATCAGCGLLVASLAPDGDLGGDHVELPLIETSAYTLGAEVARGGMGRILAARDLRVGRPVAVKELLGRSPALAARFEREARVTARLQHPGIVPIYEIGRWPDGTPFYSMRLVDGRTLREALRDATTLAGRLALLPAVIAATEAVAFAHSRHVIHRDLTPSNIIVGAYGETVVIDWGLAKDRAELDEPELPGAGSDGGDELTAAGQVIGTATYMPPEQASGAAVDERADVYALGAILYHLLAGTAPYVGRRDAVLAQVKAGPPRPVEAAAPGAPRDLVSIAGKAMAHDPAQRYATARELAEELTRFQTGRLVEAHAYSRRELWRRWIGRHRAAVIAAAAAVVAIAIAATVSFSRVVAARDRARAERTAAVAASARLLEEQGRQELLAGNPMRAATWLAEAYTAGNDGPSLRLLLGVALADVALLDRTIDCGGEVQSLELDPGGGRLVAACGDQVRVWQTDDHAPGGGGLDDPAPLVTLTTPGARLANARFSHGGATILTWGPDGVARLWDAATGALQRQLPHGAHIFNAAFAPDDATIVTTGFDGFARTWRTADGAPGRAIQVSKQLLGVRGTLAPDGKTLITATADGHATAWSLATGAAIGTIDHGAPIVGGNISPDGTRASTCGADGVARVWDAHTGALMRTLAAHADVVLTCKFSPDGARMLTTSQDGTAKIWDLASGQVVTSVSVGGVVGDGRFSADGTRFTTARLDGWLRIHAVDTGALIAAQDDPRGTVIHLFAADGNRVYAARRDGTIRVIDLRHTRLRHQRTPPADEMMVGAGADGATVVSQQGDAIVVRDVATGAIRQRAVMPPPGAWGTPRDAMAVVGLARPTTAPGPFTAGVDLDAVARVWDASHRELIGIPTARLAPHLTQIRYEPTTGTAYLAPDGALVVVSTSVAVWELPLERRTAPAVAAIVADRVPWRIAGDRLVERASELHIIVAGAGPTTIVRARRAPDVVDSTTVGGAEPPRDATRADDGSFVVALPVGRYDLEAIRPGVAPITRRITLGPGQASVTLAAE